MKNWLKKIGIAAAASTMMFTASCNNDDNDGDQTDGSTYKYVLMTMSSYVANNKPGYVSAYSELPSGDISNVGSNSLQGLGFGGWRTFKDNLFKMFNTTDYSLGIEKMIVDVDGKVTAPYFIKGGTTFGTGNMAFESDDKGFYWDGAEPLKIQVFNPTTMQRTTSYDFTSVVNQMGENEAGIKFRAIGQKFLAVKEGKLYANITYAKTDGAQKGFWDDFYPDVYLAVINTTTGAYEKTIKIANTGSIAYINENNMYDFDSNGDLYIVTQGNSVTGGNSKISRIKSGASDIDASWSLNMDDIMTGGKFVGVHAHNGKLVTLIPNTVLTGGANGNINSENIWEFYVIDVATKARTKIGGVPAIINPGASYCAVEIDGKTLLRVANKDGVINGYFEYNWSTNTAKQLFQVTAGGQVQAIAKIKVN